jgi:hypothetical protein
MAQLEAGHAAAALLGFKDRLNRHAEELHAFHDALEAFHQRFGPLDRQ